MQKQHLFRWLISFVVPIITIATCMPARADSVVGDRARFASPRFEQVWAAADRAIASGQTDRSWLWGPEPWFDYREFYKQSPNGLRLVQYFDKARMEINDPNNTSGSLQGVTNGLLVVEMVSGRVKLGDGIGADQYEQRAPAPIPVAGDMAGFNAGAPTYASFRGVATTDNGYRDGNKVGQRAGATIAENGTVGFRQDLANVPGTDLVFYEATTGHTVPRVFNDFRNNLPGVRAIDALGYPITDAYWVRTKVAGQDRDVLVQLYERRALTYTPGNPRAFQVEMGNVGQHYFLWRYPQLAGNLGAPWETPDLYYGITFASKTGSGVFNIYTDAEHSPSRQLTALPKDTLPYSIRRSWGGEDFVLGDTTATANGKRQLITVGFGRSFVNPILESNADDFDPAISPDGTKVVFASDRDGGVNLYLINLVYQPGPPARLTGTSNCTNQHPSWLRDGSGIVYESNCIGGHYAIYRGTLNYTQDQPRDVEIGPISPALATRLTGATADDRFPRVAPDGTAIAFFSLRDGNAEIYTMALDGSRQTRLTDDPAADEAPTWSPYNNLIAFNSNRTGHNEIYLMGRDGSNVLQLTNNGSENGYPVWGQ